MFTSHQRIAASAFLATLVLSPIVSFAQHNDGLSQPASVARSANMASHAKRQPLFRHPNLDAAWKTSQKTGRPVMAFITSKQCKFCDKMIAETWSNPYIAKNVATRFEPVALLKEDNLALMKQLGVRVFPTTVVVTPQGELGGHLRGFADPQKFAAMLLAPPKRQGLDVQPASYGRQR